MGAGGAIFLLSLSMNSTSAFGRFLFDSVVISFSSDFLLTTGAGAGGSSITGGEGATSFGGTNNSGNSS